MLLVLEEGLEHLSKGPVTDSNEGCSRGKETQEEGSSLTSAVTSTAHCSDSEKEAQGLVSRAQLSVTSYVTLMRLIICASLYSSVMEGSILRIVALDYIGLRDSMWYSS